MRSFLIIVFNFLAFCAIAQTNTEEDFFNDFFRNHYDTGLVIYEKCSYPKFDTAEIRLTKDALSKYLPKEEIDSMIDRASDSSFLVLDDSYVHGNRLLKAKDFSKLLLPRWEGTIEEGKKRDNDAIAKRITKEYGNPGGVVFYSIPIFDRLHEYAIMLDSFFDGLASDMSIGIYYKKNGHWALFTIAYGVMIN